MRNDSYYKVIPISGPEDKIEIDVRGGKGGNGGMGGAG
jgi:hypothetical protein